MTDPEIKITFIVTWRMDRYIAQAVFKKEEDGSYIQKSTTYFYRRALYTYEELYELATSKEKKYKDPLFGH
jgi:hypothetical protein